MDYIEFSNSKLSINYIKEEKISTKCKICGEKENLRYAVIKGYGCYICDSCRVTIAVLSKELAKI